MSEHPFAGRRAAFSLTYDDACPEHRERVAARLHAAGIHATFYLPAAWPQVQDHAAAWRSVAALGHELGNHTCHHPCRKDCAGREWVADGFDLAHYDQPRIEAELAEANRLLQAIDGRRQRSFGNTCHEDRFGTGATAGTISRLILNHCVAARGAYARERIIAPATADPANLRVIQSRLRIPPRLRQRRPRCRGCRRGERIASRDSPERTQ